MSSLGMTCGRVRRLLWPDGGPRAASQELLEAQQHLAQCDGCQRFVQDMRVQAQLVHDLALREPAPADVRRRLFTAVARARAGTQPPPRRLVPLSWLIAAVALLVLLGGTLAVDHVVRHGRADPMKQLAEDHARALGGAQIAASEPAVVSRWLGGQVDFAVFVPALPNAKLLGARLRITEGRRGAAILYDVSGVPVTYFVVPRTDAGYDAPSGTIAFERLTRTGYRVIAWREPGLLHAMVGSIPESHLATLAEACIKQARGAVTARGSDSIPKEV